MEFENVDDMSFLGGGYSRIGLPGFGGRIDDFNNAITRGHQLVDKYTDHGRGLYKGDSVVPILDHDTIRWENAPKDSLNYWDLIYEHKGQYYDGVFKKN